MVIHVTPRALVHFLSLAPDTDPLANLRSEFEVEVLVHAFASSLRYKLEDF